MNSKRAEALGALVLLFLHAQTTFSRLEQPRQSLQFTHEDLPLYFSSSAGLSSPGGQNSAMDYAPNRKQQFAERSGMDSCTCISTAMNRRTAGVPEGRRAVPEELLRVDTEELGGAQGCRRHLQGCWRWRWGEGRGSRGGRRLHFVDAGCGGAGESRRTVGEQKQLTCSKDGV